MYNFIQNIFFLIICITAFIGCTLPDKKSKLSSLNTSYAAPKPAADSTRLIGVWLDEALTWQKNQRVAYELIAKGNKTYLQVITFAGKKLNVSDNPELSSTAAEVTKSGDKYISTDLPKAVYTFDKNGDMQVYDEKGLIMKCKRML